MPYERGRVRSPKKAWLTERFGQLETAEMVFSNQFHAVNWLRPALLELAELQTLLCGLSEEVLHGTN